mmetsp:Transcript_27317/g.64023  ORF Transcript_27317/g.64023 Transcript_27317/m.64023 type:complete len:88 (-) Transcript_27317:181-444(-)
MATNSSYALKTGPPSPVDRKQIIRRKLRSSFDSPGRSRQQHIRKSSNGGADLEEKDAADLEGLDRHRSFLFERMGHNMFDQIFFARR